MTTASLMKVWCYGTVSGKSGQLVVGNIAVRDMEEARQLARRWNKDCKVSQVDLVMNAREAREATAVSAIY